jgi:hypothetical protein
VSTLTVGATLEGRQITVTEKEQRLPGRWSVWSAANDAPGAHFITPVDGAARATGLKYAVVRATPPKAATEPLITLIRTDPPRSTR